MILIVLEYLFLTIIFITLYYVGINQKRKKRIIPVKDLRHKCTCEVERLLYDGLIKHGVYVTPAVQLGVCSIPLALEQYKVAIFFYPKQPTAILRRLIVKHKELYLRSTGWKVLKFSNEAIQANFDGVIQMVLNTEKIKKI
ncbi:DUF559 domain-containing protein [Anaerobacillus sp. CMMVII]|uniref:endonuclease domain-containing protein n=1 Tax=Anaerobacillus sp. CMMVII TaxID=2755588 RepID=UPI0021B79B3D|nr:endonuclease domain-containing protein [Anaerobacillus sp. CMMVII]MCT8137468.1 DUF559 domain-containing protein [Anaerobacillus sp. CMMVII]